MLKKKLDKKGMSNIVSTVIIIALVIASVVIVWNVIQGTIGSQGERIEQGIQNVRLDVEKVELNEEEGLAKVKITRESGEGNMTHVKITLDDGDSSENVEREASFETGQGTTFEINQSEDVDNVNLANLQEVKAVPIIRLENKETEGDLEASKKRKDFLIN